MVGKDKARPSKGGDAIPCTAAVPRPGGRDKGDPLVALLMPCLLDSGVAAPSFAAAFPVVLIVTLELDGASCAALPVGTVSSDTKGEIFLDVFGLDEVIKFFVVAVVCFMVGRASFGTLGRGRTVNSLLV